MNLELTKEQRFIQMAAREFAEKEFTKELVEMCDQGDFPWELYRKAGKLGFIDPYIDEKYGGQSLGLLESTLIIEEFCRVDSGVGITIYGGIGAPLVYMFGTEEQKMRYLPKVCSDESTGAGAFTEPNHGSDILFLETTAIEDEDYFILNGLRPLLRGLRLLTS